MDSGTSGSIHSSSGGDEELESRSDTISALLNSRPLTNPNLIMNHEPFLTRNLSSFVIPSSSSNPSSSGLGIMISSTSPARTADAQPTATRTSKKRSRASRRAPTTVLTTDTSNFRAMVQEFTGIPSAPFAGTALSRPRLGLLASAMRSRCNELSPSSLSSSLLPRPFAVNPNISPPPLSSSSFVNILSSCTNAANTVTNNDPSNSSNFQMLSHDLRLPKQPNLMSTQNPIFSFQSLLQTAPSSSTSPNFPIGNMQVLNQFSSDGLQTRSDDTQIWVDRTNREEQVRSFNGDTQGIDSCKMNPNPSSSDFNSEKASEIATSGGEGTVESWFFPSG